MCDCARDHIVDTTCLECTEKAKGNVTVMFIFLYSTITFNRIKEFLKSHIAHSFLDVRTVPLGPLQTKESDPFLPYWGELVMLAKQQAAARQRVKVMDDISMSVVAHLIQSTHMTSAKQHRMRIPWWYAPCSP